jgi:2-polyprenyl-3-methyl-5-hydroxy-6-metoxy-1,4-benzoquinol methylase
MGFSAEFDFSRRLSPHELPELMDGDCSYDDFRDCLRSLEQVNRLLMGYRATLAWLEQLSRTGRGPLHIVDVGFGGGDLLRRIARWACHRRLSVQLTGIDRNPYAARVAAESTPKELGITWLTCDALDFRPRERIDIVVSSLMEHHLENEEIIRQLRWMEAAAQTGWFINDLERTKWACRSFEWVAAALGWHRFVRLDGPVSFRRAFRKDDWVKLLATAEIPLQAVTIERSWPGRLCVGRWK